MDGQATTTVPQRITALVAGVVVCLLIVVAMFSEPAGKTASMSFPAVTSDLTAASDGDFAFTPLNLLGLFVVGLVSGTFGGMLGMGGGMLKMSFLLCFFGFPTAVPRFAALLSYFVVAVGSSYQYLKLKLVMTEVVKVLIPSSILGIIVGAVVGHYLPRDVMTMLLGVFLLFVSVVMAKKVLIRTPASWPPTAAAEQERDRAVNATPPVGAWRLALCGVPGGFLSAMLGISGGVATNPLQQILGRIPIKNAIANTLATASATVPIACLIIMVMGVRAGHCDVVTPMLVALCLIPGSIIGSQLGPALTKRMSPAAIRSVFGAVALLMGVKMLFFSQ